MAFAAFAAGSTTAAGVLGFAGARSAASTGAATSAAAFVGSAAAAAGPAPKDWHPPNSEAERFHRSARLGRRIRPSDAEARPLAVRRHASVAHPPTATTATAASAAPPSRAGDGLRFLSVRRGSGWFRPLAFGFWSSGVAAATTGSGTRFFLRLCYRRGPLLPRLTRLFTWPPVSWPALLNTRRSVRSAPCSDLRSPFGHPFSGGATGTIFRSKLMRIDPRLRLHPRPRDHGDALVFRVGILPNNSSHSPIGLRPLLRPDRHRGVDRLEELLAVPRPIACSERFSSEAPVHSLEDFGRLRPGHAFVEHDAERVDVGPRPLWVGFHILLDRSVGRGVERDLVLVASAVSNRADPKSIRTGRPSSLIRMFGGLMSRWRTPTR